MVARLRTRDGATRKDVMHQFEAVVCTFPPDLGGRVTSGVPIKEHAKSSADNDIKFPDLLRTPITLLRTVEYMEDYVMQQDHGDFDETDGLSVRLYKFIGGRYRMVGKDFILQGYQSGMRNDRVCIEVRVAHIYILTLTHPGPVLWRLYECILNGPCKHIAPVLDSRTLTPLRLDSYHHTTHPNPASKVHERMVRWFIYMQHYMACDGSGFWDINAVPNFQEFNDMMKSLKVRFFTFSYFRTIFVLHLLVWIYCPPASRFLALTPTPTHISHFTSRQTASLPQMPQKYSHTTFCAISTPPTRMCET